MPKIEPKKCDYGRFTRENTKIRHNQLYSMKEIIGYAILIIMIALLFITILSGAVVGWFRKEGKS